MVCLIWSLRSDFLASHLPSIDKFVAILRLVTFRKKRNSDWLDSQLHPSPAQEARAEHGPNRTAERNQRAVPDCDERHGVVRAVKRIGCCAYRPGDKSRDGPGLPQIRGCSFAQSPDQRCKWNDSKEWDAKQAGRPMHSEHHATPSHRLPKSQRSNACTYNNEERKKQKREEFSPILARAHQPFQQGRPHSNQAQRKQQLEGKVARKEAIRNPSPETDGCQHQAEGGSSAYDKGPNQRFPEPSLLDGLHVCAEHVDQLVSFHDGFSSRIRRARAFKPRCTDTFTADSDIPDRAAASLTLNPSSFTY